MDFKKVKLQGKGGKRQLKTETKKAKKSSYWSFFFLFALFLLFMFQLLLPFPPFFCLVLLLPFLFPFVSIYVGTKRIDCCCMYAKP
jgi:hypothetical protein